MDSHSQRLGSPIASVKDASTHSSSSASDISSTVSVSPPRSRTITTSWPVPQVIISCMGLKSAWGRRELIALGYEGTFKRIRETYILQDVHYYYNTITRLKGTFHNVHGNGDSDSVLLHPVGWAELVENLESIEVEFHYTNGYPIWDPTRLPKA